MHPELESYKNLKICVAVSGGKDSMALLHYLFTRGKEYGITLSALNCDHGIRGDASAKDSAFVLEYCRTNGIPLLFFEYSEDKKLTEQSARAWRHKCYAAATAQGADAVATAHHLNDNAETVLFNLARGSGLAGAAGITDTVINGTCRVIHPLITASREEIDGYIERNNIPYVTDESNFCDDYTRNKIRHNVLPELEKAVNGASRALYRFSRIAKETEDYFDDLIEKNGYICGIYGGQLIKTIPERAVFERAALKVFFAFQLKDYTKDHIEKLYSLQSAENGKKFEFLNLVACKEQNGLSITYKQARGGGATLPFTKAYGHAEDFCGEYIFIGGREDGEALKTDSRKILRFDPDKIPQNAEIRFKRQGDVFTKFGGGTKKLADYFTDIKLPQRLRGRVPLLCDGNDVLLIFGVEISEKIKVTEATKTIAAALSADYRIR